MANLIYHLPETGHAWSDATTALDDTLDLGGLASGSVRAGDIWDRGASAYPAWFTWHFIVDGFDTAPVVGEAVNLYLAFSYDGTSIDGDLSGTDAGSSTVVLPNCKFLGSAVVQTTTAANELIVSGQVFIIQRYVIPVVHNNTADALLSTSDAHTFALKPVPPQIQ